MLKLIQQVVLLWACLVDIIDISEVDVNNKIRIFENQKIRSVWSEKEEEWYFSIIDVVGVLIEQQNYTIARKYWNKLKQRLVKEGAELVTNCHQLKLISPRDGKKYLTDVATIKQLFRIIQSIPSKISLQN